jgi:hypothetical protein
LTEFLKLKVSCKVSIFAPKDVEFHSLQHYMTCEWKRDIFYYRCHKFIVCLSQLEYTGHMNVWIAVQRKNLVLKIQVHSLVEFQILYLLGYKGNFFTNRKSEKNAPRFSAIYSGSPIINCYLFVSSNHNRLII